MNWMSVVGLCLIVLGTVFSFFGTYMSSKKSQNELTEKIQEKNSIIDDINNNNVKLIDQNSTLLISTEDVSKTNKDLILQNNQMLDKIANYQSDIEERNIKIKQLEKEILNVKEYSVYATYSIYGTNIKAGSLIKISSDLFDRMKNILFEIEGKVSVNCIKENLPLVDDIIEKYPNFPFGYFAKYEILNKLGDYERLKYAIKAIEILEVTTSIDGHDSSHDVVLNILRQAINNDK